MTKQVIGESHKSNQQQNVDEVNNNSLLVFYGVIPDICDMPPRKKKGGARGAPRKNKAPRPRWAARLEMSLEAAGYPKGTYPELAKLLGVVPATISSWINGRTQPKFHMMEKIREITGTTIDWIITGKGEPPAEARRESHSAA